MAANLSRFSLYKRRNQIYYIGYYANGRRHWKSTGVNRRLEALKVLTRFRELLNERSRCVMLQQFISDFLAFAEANYQPNTVGIYGRCLERFSRLAGNIALNEVTPEHLDKYKTKRLKDMTAEYTGNRDEKKLKPISPATVNNELRALRAAFSTAKRRKSIDVEPFDGVSFAEIPEQAASYFTTNDFQKFVDCIREGWFREVVLFAVLTGIRRGEILNLRWNDVDLNGKVVHIHTSPSYKTKAGRRRTIFLNDTALYVPTSRQGKSASDYIFTLNDKPISDGWVTHLSRGTSGVQNSATGACTSTVYATPSRHGLCRTVFHSTKCRSYLVTLPAK